MTDNPAEKEPLPGPGIPVVAILFGTMTIGAAVGLVLVAVSCGLYFDYQYPGSNLAGFVAIVYAFKYGATIGAFIGGCVGLVVANKRKRLD
jgi:hypothetical protein